MKFVNLTQHPITLIGPSLSIPTSGSVARVREETLSNGTLSYAGGEIPLVMKRYGEVEGLPPPASGTIFIVSSLVAIAAWEEGRTDVVAPGDIVRDRAGKVLGCLNLATRGQP